MQALSGTERISVEDYLAGELSSEVRHEYLAGVVYAMAGASEEHNTLTVNLVSALHSHLRGKPCRAFVADMKVRLAVAHEDIFYYPDVVVVCDSRDTHRHYKSFPKVVIEVLSPDTERIDRREKFLSYTQIETLEEYVLVAQDRLEVTLFRRAAQWAPEVTRQPDAMLRLPSLDFTMPLRDVYENVGVIR